MKDEMKPFKALTRRGRLFRLRQLASLALKAYGLQDAQLIFLQYFENIIYRVDVRTGALPDKNNDPYIANRYLLRIHAMGDVSAIASELTWLDALSREAGLPVPAPVPTCEGKLLTTITTRGMPKGRVVSLMRWLDGRKLERGLKPNHLTALGQAVALLHNFSTRWQPPHGFTRPHWDWDAQLGGSMFKHARDELVASMPLRIQEPFEILSRETKRAMQALGKGADAYGLIHSDLYPENVLFKAGKAYPIDFEDCGYGYWLWDIAIALSEWAWGESWERMRDAFYQGYARQRTLPAVQWSLLDLFVATQFATMVLWASEFLMNDPMRVAEYEPWREKNVTKLLNYFNR